MVINMGDKNQQPEIANERKQYEESLKFERDRYNDLFQKVPCAIVQFDLLDGAKRVRNFNDETWRLLNYKSRKEYEEMLETQQGGSSEVYEDDIPYTRMLYERVLKSIHPVSFVHRLICKGGEVKWIYGKAEICTDENGENYYQCIFMDDTARREDELQKEKNYKEELFYMSNASENLISRIRFNVTSNQIERYKAREDVAIPGADKMSYDEFVETLMGQAVDEEEKENAKALLDRTYLKAAFKKGKNTIRVEFRRKSRTRKFIWNSMLIKLVQEPNTKNLIGFIYTEEENSDRLEASVISRRIHQLYTVMNHIFYCVVVLDYHKNKYDIVQYSYSEENMESVSGSMEELKKLLETLYDEGQREYTDILLDKSRLREKFAHGEKEFSFDALINRKPARAWFNHRVLPVEKSGKRCEDVYLLSIMDIDERKRRELEQKESESTRASLKRLAAFEKAYEALKQDSDEAAVKMEALKAQGKTSSATFRQLLAKKVNAENMLKLFEIYGIDD